MQGINTPKEQPIEDEELESFRLQWLEEVSHKLNAPKSLTEEKSQIINAPAELSPTVHVPVSLPPSLSDAAYPRQSPQQSDAKSGYLVRLKAEDPGLEAYVRGSQHERMGNLSGAISSYREALKIDPTVEERFRKIVLQPSHPLHQRENELDPNLAFYTYYNFGEAKSTAATQNMETLITDLAAVNLELKPMYPTRSTVFLRFPGELVSLTVKWAFLLLGHEAIYNLSLVCQRMLRTCREPSVWRSACLAALKPEVGSASLEEELPLYQDSWFGMWLDHPRIRRDGVYISRVNYTSCTCGQLRWNLH
ncbi:hypothetical protein DFS34DRAFT_686838 [Phlyctochytrium arcticum]|nr:hypothetical protein DFS34DRAFT_686838 [Phlyctochytrium arcticum]